MLIFNWLILRLGDQVLSALLSSNSFLILKLFNLRAKYIIFMVLQWHISYLQYKYKIKYIKYTVWTWINPFNNIFKIIWHEYLRSVLTFDISQGFIIVEVFWPVRMKDGCSKYFLPLAEEIFTLHKMQFIKLICDKALLLNCKLL